MHSPSPQQTAASLQVTATNSTTQYSFPHNRLKLRQSQRGKTPLVLVACGSFSPITYLHLRMFEMASDYIRLNTQFEIVGGYLSPVSDGYQKVGLAQCHHRVNMCQAAVESSPWLMVDPYETVQRNACDEPEFVPTAVVLRHFDHEINTVLGGIQAKDGTIKKARIALLAGADLIMSMGNPDLWSSDDLDIILGSYGAYVIERSGTNIDDVLASLQQYKKNIWIIQQLIQNDISSTNIRLFLKKHLSVRYLLPDSVISYIDQHGLFGVPRAELNA